MKNNVFKAIIACAVLLANQALADITEYSKYVFTGWTGDLEAGATLASGNTEKETLRGAFKLNKEGKKKNWGHTIKGSSNTSTENNIQSEEEYRVLGQTRYNISADDFAFAELDYVNDRFSGFQYRISEGVGYGRKFYHTENLSIVGEVSLGGRHTLDTQEVKTNNMLAKVSGKVQWHLNEHVELTEDFSIAIAESIITLSETALKNALSENLYLKVSLMIENNSDVPLDKKSTDTLTSVSIGYNF